MSIHAVLWDFGGVITTSPFEAFNRYESDNGLPTDFIRTINATNGDHNAWAKLESSQVSVEEFDLLFANESREQGHEIRGADVLKLLSGDIRPVMVEALKTLKSHYKLGCLTNNVKSGEGPGMARDGEKATRVEAVMGLFDAVIESSKVGVRKPDPAFYRLACDTLQIEPEQAIFLDDLGVNLKPAKAMGMKTIKVLSAKQALEELELHLNLPLWRA